MNILLVEDDAINQKIASQFLRKWGLTVTIANDGREALNILQQRIFGLILMDINMPEMDGCETTHTIRSSQDPYFKNIPILAFTASSVADTKEKAERLGMNDFVKKPLDPSDMHNKINHYILSEYIESRPLKIKFELYADSDTTFKQELIALIISNLRELQEASYKALYSQEINLFQSKSHKIKSALILLDDHEYNIVVEDLKHSLSADTKAEAIQQKIHNFNLMTESIIRSLENESSILAASS
ncbi:response regulator [Chryseosolibacter indicus]|uniref:Response regulator n=1 Tax=Chryseosolibacter indicus TaxID=2782351 RepID=A0ABS5VKI1_9BACT|nr:response regulator [Chryseosolibacter indicus]MBT1701886.1 response regulator [Chryseosolibacter indicus]